MGEGLKSRQLLKVGVVTVVCHGPACRVEKTAKLHPLTPPLTPPLHQGTLRINLKSFQDAYIDDPVRE